MGTAEGEMGVGSGVFLGLVRALKSPGHTAVRQDLAQMIPKLQAAPHSPWMEVAPLDPPLPTTAVHCSCGTSHTDLSCLDASLLRD